MLQQKHGRKIVLDIIDEPVVMHNIQTIQIFSLEIDGILDFMKQLIEKLKKKLTHILTIKLAIKIMY